MCGLNADNIWRGLPKRWRERKLKGKGGGCFADSVGDRTMNIIGIWGGGWGGLMIALRAYYNRAHGGVKLELWEMMGGGEVTYSRNYAE